MIVNKIDIADEFHLDESSLRGFERQVFETNVLALLQLCEVGLAGDDVLEEAHFPYLPAEDLFALKTQEIDQERIDIIDGAGFCIQNQDAVFRRLKETPVAHFGRFQRRLYSFAVGYYIKYGNNMLFPGTIYGNIKPHFKGFHIGLKPFRFAGERNPAINFEKSGIRLPYARNDLRYFFPGDIFQSCQRFKSLINAQIDEIMRHFLFKEHPAIGKSVQHIFEKGTI